MNDVPSLDEETFSDFFNYPTHLVWHHGEGNECWWSWNNSKKDRPCVERVILKKIMTKEYQTCQVTKELFKFLCWFVMRHLQGLTRLETLTSLQRNSVRRKRSWNLRVKELLKMELLTSVPGGISMQAETFPFVHCLNVGKRCKIFILNWGTPVDSHLSPEHVKFANHPSGDYQQTINNLLSSICISSR